MQSHTLMLPGFGPPEKERVPIVLPPWTKRHYQLTAERKFFELTAKGRRKPLACMATGSGKTRTATMGIVRRVLAEKRCHVLWLSHLNTLIEQTRDAMSSMLGEPIGLEQGFRQWQGERICVASTASLRSKKRIDRIAGRGALIVLDEAHHYVEEGNLEIVNTLFNARNDAMILGLTATPIRRDKKSMSRIFDSLLLNYPIKEGIDDGYLVPIVMDIAEIPDMDFSNLTKRQFTDENKGTVLEKNKVLNSIVLKTLERIGDRRGAMFFPTVKVAHLAAEIFNKHRSGCATSIDGTTMDKEIKDARIKQFKHGSYQIVCNVGVLSEGYDDPGIGFVGLCSHTDSVSVYLQQLGRGTRNICRVDDYATSSERRIAIANSEKPDLLIIDYVGNAGKHDIVSAVDALADSTLDEKVIKKAKEIAKDGPQSLDEIITKAEQSIKREEEAERISKSGTIDIRLRRVDPFESKGGINSPPTAKKAMDRSDIDLPGFLKDHGVDYSDMDSTEMYAKRDEIRARKNQGLCSFKQKNLIEKICRIDASKLKSGTAGALIGAMFVTAKIAGKPPGSLLKPSQSQINEILKGN